MKYFVYPSRIKKTNLGDILINILLIRELSNHGIVYLDGEISELIELIQNNNPNAKNILIIDGIKKLHGLPVLRWINFAGKLRDIDIVFDPPGHYSEGDNNAKFILKSFKYLFRAKTLALINIKMARLGITLGPFSINGWRFQKQISESYHNMSVRDSKNYNDVLSKGLKNIKLVDDLAFLYRPEDFITNYSISKQNSKYIVISFRGAIEGGVTERDYLNQVFTKLSYMLRQGDFKDLLCVFSYQVEEDLEVLKILIEKFEGFPLNYQLLQEQLTFTSAIELYYNAELVFTNRLHVALLSMLNKTPALIITDLAKHHKLVDVYIDLGLNEFLFNCNDVSQDKSIRVHQIVQIMEAFEKVSFQKNKELKTSIREIVD